MLVFLLASLTAYATPPADTETLTENIVLADECDQSAQSEVMDELTALLAVVRERLPEATAIVDAMDTGVELEPVGPILLIEDDANDCSEDGTPAPCVAPPVVIETTEE